MKVLSVVGARPQFVKLAPIAAAARETQHEHVILHTGQHYDRNMSDVFFAGLEIPEPDVSLGVGSSSHGRQTARMLEGVEAVIEDVEPDVVLVYGDTNSTLAAAVAAVKLGVYLAHLEAGLRSFNRAMPEEHNRVLTDHAADLLLAPSATAMANLEREGLAGRSSLAGDVMVDITLEVARTFDADGAAPLRSDDYVLSTIHRPQNTDDAQRLEAILGALRAMPVPVVLPAHPRLVARCELHGIELGGGSLEIVEPLDYAAMVAALRGCVGVVTDSGGLQKEAFVLRAPCTTVRTETEWTETLQDGWNVLASPEDLRPELVLREPGAPTDPFPYGRGDAAHAVWRILDERTG